MLLHLIIWAIRAATKDSSASAGTAAMGAKRRTPAGHVTLECPFCQALGVAAQYHLDERTSAGWQRAMEIYECRSCRRTMNAAALQNDGTGVLTVKTWDCPACKTANPAVRFDCASCGARIC